MLSSNEFEINLKSIKSNIEYIKNKYNDYDYYIGVVKANAYGCGYYKVIETMDKAGINFFTVNSIEEALEVRKYTKNGILILSPILLNNIDECIKNNISITIDNLEYLKQIKQTINLKVHIAINTGMNRYGVNNINELNEIMEYCKEKEIIVEGIFTHLYYASNKETTNKQIEIFNNYIENIDYKNIKMIHVMNSEGLLNYNKIKYTNAIRVGDLLYGLTRDKSFKSVYSLKSKINEIRQLKKGDTLGYDAGYKAEKDELIAVIPIGYCSGITKNNKGRFVYINNKKYQIVGNICMCNIFVKIDDSIKQTDEVDIIKDSYDVLDIADYINTAPSEITCIIDKNIKKIYRVE